MVEIEATGNNHPLMYIYDDENGVLYTLIIPADLVYGCRIFMTPSGQHFDVSTNQSLTKQAKHYFKLLDTYIIICNTITFS